MALGVMDRARYDFGPRLPEEVSIIGYDDIPQAERPSYRLTAFEQPAGEIVPRLARRHAVRG